MGGTLIIGGTGAYHLDVDRYAEREAMVDTPHGPAGPVSFLRLGEAPCAMLSRHGGRGRLGVTPPYINYRANVWAARELGMKRILSWNSAGSLVRSLEPGCVAVVADLIDWTRRRPSSYGIGPSEEAAIPLFDGDLRERLVRAASTEEFRVAPAAVYAATSGARLETAAEIRLLRQAGAELVGMTLAPEVFLARELGIPYAAICWVSNYATGVPFAGPERRLFGPEVGSHMFAILLKLMEEERGTR